MKKIDPTSQNQRSERLLERARDGDVAAFEELIGPHVASVRRYTAGFAKGRDVADDLAQDVLLRAWQRIGSFQGRSAFSTWLYRLTRNVCIDWTRSRAAKQQAAEMGALGVELEPDTAPGQDVQLQRRRDAARLRAAIATLPERFRTTLVLFCIEGLSYQEVSEVVDVPVGTVRSRLFRAKKMLADVLGENI